MPITSAPFTKTGAITTAVTGDPDGLSLLTSRRAATGFPVPDGTVAAETDKCESSENRGERQQLLHTNVPENQFTLRIEREWKKCNNWLFQQIFI